MPLLGSVSSHPNHFVCNLIRDNPIPEVSVSSPATEAWIPVADFGNPTQPELSAAIRAEFSLTPERDGGLFKAATLNLHQLQLQKVKA